jgi:putative flippase GtrA
MWVVRRVRQNKMFWQLVRYIIVGGGITAYGAAVYWLFAELVGIAPLLANSIAFVTGVAIGYVLHSRLSFDADPAHAVGRTTMRFVIVNLLGFAMNSLWVWTLVEWLGGPTWWPIVPMVCVTPLTTFALHRGWTFGQRDHA